MTAEARVHAAIRAALDDAYRLYVNVRWISRPGSDGPARDGETDLVIVHPDDGLLVVETKGGLIRRDGQGRWWSGEHPLSTSPFRQAEVSKHALVRLLADLPDWPGRDADIRAGHAVAFPDVDLATVAHPGHDLGPDAPSELVLDGSKLTSPAAVRAWVERAYGYWNGDGRRGRAFSAAELALIEERLSPPPLELGPALRRRVGEGEPQVVTLTRGQYHVLDTLRRQRRAGAAGAAGALALSLPGSCTGRMIRPTSQRHTSFGAPHEPVVGHPGRWVHSLAEEGRPWAGLGPPCQGLAGPSVSSVAGHKAGRGGAAGPREPRRNDPGPSARHALTP